MQQVHVDSNSSFPVFEEGRWLSGEDSEMPVGYFSSHFNFVLRRRDS